MRRAKRTIRLLAITVVTCLALGATASAAQAYEWIVNEEVLPEGVHYPLTCSQEKPMELTGKIAGIAIKISAEVTCVEWVIFNSGGNAFSIGKYAFGAPTISGAPAGCTVNGFTTNGLAGKAVAAPKLPSELAVAYAPSVGTTIASVVLKTCGAATGTSPLKGTLAAEVEPLNVLKEIQPYKFSSAIATAVGTSMTLGTEPATLTGLVNFKF